MKHITGGFFFLWFLHQFTLHTWLPCTLIFFSTSEEQGFSIFYSKQPIWYPQGLVVPVLRNCEKMNFAEVEKEINTLAKKATDGTISIDEMAGGTFTISNGGVYGSLLSTPIINPPQVWASQAFILLFTSVPMLYTTNIGTVNLSSPVETQLFKLLLEFV